MRKITSKIKNSLRKAVFNLPGWHTNRKIVVFESDDWGMIRMASRDSYTYLLNKGYPVDECIYNRNDSLESDEDLERLFEVLLSIKDQHGNYPVITANNIVANPDFDKIKQDNFESYHYESFDNTLKRYPGSDRVLSLYRSGIKNRIFIPQLHGREHVNVSNWLDALKTGNKVVKELFTHQMFTAHVHKNNLSCSLEYLDAFGQQNGRVKFDISEIIEDAANIFEQLHHYRSDSFIAPCYTWPDELLTGLNNTGIRIIQGGTTQKHPVSTGKGFKKKWHFTGQKNIYNQFYLIRNASFELAENPDWDWVSKCTKEIAVAFHYKKPAVVSVHRVNFMGSINPANRHNTLKQFKKLLTNILTYWPDVEFMSTPDLGHLISKSIRSKQYEQVTFS
jgi:hypothetical protein